MHIETILKYKKWDAFCLLVVLKAILFKIEFGIGSYTLPHDGTKSQLFSGRPLDGSFEGNFQMSDGECDSHVVGFGFEPKLS